MRFKLSFIERVIFSADWDELVASTRALDRVLLWNHYVVPQWTIGVERTARWHRFARPAQMPKYGAAAFSTLWWKSVIIDQKPGRFEQENGKRQRR